MNKSKTVKSRIPSRNNAIKQFYNKDYYGKNLLPITKIVQYIDANFNDYMVMKQQKITQDLPASSFEDFSSSLLIFSILFTLSYSL